MEGPEYKFNRREQPPEAVFTGFDTVLQQFVDGTLDINKVIGRSANTTYRDDPNTWISVTKKNQDGTLDIVIGTQGISEERRLSWKWGAITPEQQFVVKVAHEYAHVLQNKFDADLTAWLDGANIDENSNSVAYIRLYAFFAQAEGLNGLAKDPVYHKQNERAGYLNVPAYEDMAETLAAAFLGKEYFLFRVKQFRTQLPQDIVNGLWDSIQKVVSKWEIS